MKDLELKRTPTDNEKAERRMDILSEKISNNRRYFGSSGASLTHQMGDPKYKDSGISSSLAAVGLEGERRTTKVLKEWMKDKPNVVVIDSVHIKGAGTETLNEETGTMDGGDTDHVIIIGDVVIILDSKNWKGKRRYSVKQDGVVIRGNSTFPGGNLNTNAATHLWRRYLSQHNPMVSAVVCITSEKVWVTRDANWWKQSFRLVTLENLTDFLTDAYNGLPDKSKNHVNLNMIADIVAMAIKPYNPVQELLGEVSYLLQTPEGNKPAEDDTESTDAPSA